MPGRQEIPFPYVLDPGHALSLDEVSALELARWFPATELAHIGDEIADGLPTPDEARPLALFDGLRTDFSLARLRHYTGTPPEHVQRYVLFTNYHRYVDEFVRWAFDQLGRRQPLHRRCPARAACCCARATISTRRWPIPARGGGTRCRPII